MRRFVLLPLLALSGCGVANDAARLRSSGIRVTSITTEKPDMVPGESGIPVFLTLTNYLPVDSDIPDIHPEAHVGGIDVSALVTFLHSPASPVSIPAFGQVTIEIDLGLDPSVPPGHAVIAFHADESRAHLTIPVVAVATVRMSGAWTSGACASRDSVLTIGLDNDGGEAAIVTPSAMTVVDATGQPSPLVSESPALLKIPPHSGVSLGVVMKAYPGQLSVMAASLAIAWTGQRSGIPGNAALDGVEIPFDPSVLSLEIVNPYQTLIAGSGYSIDVRITNDGADTTVGGSYLDLFELGGETTSDYSAFPNLAGTPLPHGTTVIPLPFQVLSGAHPGTTWAKFFLGKQGTASGPDCEALGSGDLVNLWSVQ